MIKAFSSKAWQEYLDWQREDKNMLKRIHLLIKDIERQPYEGIGKPEALKHHLSGWWSRRINDEHRLVYTIDHQTLRVVALKYHYS